MNWISKSWQFTFKPKSSSFGLYGCLSWGWFSLKTLKIYVQYRTDCSTLCFLFWKNIFYKRNFIFNWNKMKMKIQNTVTSSLHQTINRFVELKIFSQETVWSRTIWERCCSYGCRYFLGEFWLLWISLDTKWKIPIWIPSLHEHWFISYYYTGITTVLSLVPV